MAFRRLFSRSPTTTTTPTGPSFSDVFDDVFFGPGGLFPMSQEWKTDPKLPRPPANSKQHGSIPIHVDDAENKREAKGQRRRADPLVASMAKAAAAVRLQAAARGFLARRSVRAVREVERKAEAVEYIVRQREEELRRNHSARVAVAEALMGMLLRLDAVRGAREYRRRVARKVLALQDAVDGLEPKAAAAAEATAEDEIGEENTAGEAEPASDDASRGDDKPDCSDADAEWEILKEEKEPTAPPRHDLAGQGIAEAADAGAGAVDTGKLMEMVAALWERNAEQSALIGALAERVDALERTVRRMEDAERRA